MGIIACNHGDTEMGARLRLAEGDPRGRRPDTPQSRRGQRSGGHSHQGIHTFWHGLPSSAGLTEVLMWVCHLLLSTVSGEERHPPRTGLHPAVVTSSFHIPAGMCPGYKGDITVCPKSKSVASLLS